MAKSKMSTMTLVCTIAMAVGAVVAIVALFLNWATLSASLLGETAKIADVKLFDMDEFWGVMAIIFAVITAIASVACAVVALLKSFSNFKLDAKIAMIIGIVTVACAVIALVCTFIFGGQYSDGNEYASAKVAPAIGAWLLAIGGVISGAACIANK